MDAIEKLTQAFVRFPGIGPRQARRFVSYLLTAPPSATRELADLINRLQQESSQCTLCGRHFMPRHKEASACRVCADGNREQHTLMVVEKDVDVDHIDRAGTYRGGFFVLGGTVPLLEKNPETKIRINELLRTAEERGTHGLQEIVLALSTNIEGEETVSYLRGRLKPICDAHNITVSTLGRGLSTGAEIEYADMETIKNAFRNRSL